METFYRLFMDESGDHTYDKKVVGSCTIKVGEKKYSFQDDQWPELDNPAKRYLGLTGCIVETQYYAKSFVPSLEAIKEKHLGGKEVILHRKEIINRKGPFWRLRDPANEKIFNEALLLFLREQQYVLITVVIDKLAHVQRYEKYAYHPYHFCLAAMLERYSGFLRARCARGDIMAESRGGVEDRLLMQAYRKVYETGTQYWKPDSFHVVLTSKEIKVKPKTANIGGIQIADLLAFPSKQAILRGHNRIPESDRLLFGGKVCEAIEAKYNSYKGTDDGYGKVFIK